MNLRTAVARLVVLSLALIACLLSGGVQPPPARAQAPQPTIHTAAAAVTPSPLTADLRTLPYLPATPNSAPELGLQPSLFKWAASLKAGSSQPALVQAPTALMPAPQLTFNAMTFATNGAGHPPDTVGDVGPNHYMEAVNTSFAIYDKQTGTQLVSQTFNSFWAGAGTGTACDTSNQGDPIVLFDALQDRWVFMDFAWTGPVNPPYYFCVGVSMTSDPVSGGYWRYAIRADDAAHPWLPDYPKGAIWPDGLYFSANMFPCSSGSCGSVQEERAFVYNRLKLEAGATLTAGDMQTVDTNTTARFTLMPSNVRGKLPPAGSPNYFVNESTSAFAWEVFKFHVDYVTPGNSTFTGPTIVSQAAYGSPPAAVVSEPSPGNNIDTLADRIMFLNQYRNLAGAESLWVQHTTGTASTTSPTSIQWAQINVTGGVVTATPVQEQIFNNGADGLNRFMGSLAVDSSGNAALGYSVSSASVAPDIRYTGRLAGDTLGQMPQGETTMLPAVTRSVQTGTCGPSTCTRWGDYSAMSVDPVDDCTFWYVNEFYPVSGTNWVTRIGDFSFAQPAQCNPIAHQAAAKTQHTPVFDGSVQLGNDYNYATEWLGTKGGVDFYTTWDATNLYAGMIGKTLYTNATAGCATAGGCTYVAVVDTDPATQSASNTGAAAAFACASFNANGKGNFALSRTGAATTKNQANAGAWVAWLPGATSNALDNTLNNVEFRFAFADLGVAAGSKVGLYLYVCDGTSLVAAWPPENLQSGVSPVLNVESLMVTASGIAPRIAVQHSGDEQVTAAATGLKTLLNGYVTLNVTTAGGAACTFDARVNGNTPGSTNIISRTYTLTPNTCAGLVGDLTLKYEDGTLTSGAAINNVPSELGSFNPSTFAMLRQSSGSWSDVSATSHNTAAKTITKNGVSQFSPWSMGSSSPTAVDVERIEAHDLAPGVDPLPVLALAALALLAAGFLFIRSRVAL